MSNESARQSQIAGAAIMARIGALAAFSDDPSCLTRLTLSLAHRGAAGLVLQWMREAGMQAHVDAAGNAVGRYEAANADAKTLLIGSHIDTVRNAGRFDGNLGVIAGIAIVDELNRLEHRLPCALEIIAFSDEEGSRFASTLSGSRALAGAFDASCLDDADGDGVTRRAALAAFGGDGALCGGLARDPARTLAYLEVHIEQGPVLEARNLPLGIVTAINGATRGEVIVAGEAGHAGTLPMDMRRDALAAAAEMILAIEARAKRGADFVATVGRIEIPNAAVNIVPGEARFSLDLRSASDDARSNALADIETDIARIASSRNVGARFTPSHGMPAAPCDPRIMDAMERVFRARGYEPFRLASGAGHDAMSFRGRIPIGMIFVRCRGGISHHPSEFASAADCEAASRVLFDLVKDFGALA